MTELELVITAQRAVVAGREQPVAIGVSGGRITVLAPIDDEPPARRRVHYDDEVVVLPGLVDTHVHLQDPGRPGWEGFGSGTAAAAAGGVTTLVDMPLDSLPVTTDVDALLVKQRAARCACRVEVGFWAGAVPDNLHRLRSLHDAGVLGFKCFLSDSGIPEFPPLSAEQLRTALAGLADFGGLLLVHAEDQRVLAAVDSVPSRTYADFLQSRPERAEDSAVAMVVEALRRAGGRAHIAHVSSATAAATIAAAQREGLPLSAETCPHYLALQAGDVPDGATRFKACPPIRDGDNRRRLWDALAAGVLSMIVSDHSPTGSSMRDSGDFAEAPGGISSLELALPVVWTEARRRGIPLATIASWMAERPAALAGLHRKGAIAKGRDADLCVFAPDQEFTVEPRLLVQRNPVTPYAGQRLHGVVRATWLRGEPVDPDEPRGRLLASRPPQARHLRGLQARTVAVTPPERDRARRAGRSRPHRSRGSSA